MIFAFRRPASSQLSKEWTSYSQRDLAGLQIAPGNKIALGVYADPSIAEFLAGNPARKPSTIQASVDVAARCPAGREAALPKPDGDRGEWYCDVMIQAGWKFPPETVEVCKKTM